MKINEQTNRDIKINLLLLVLLFPFPTHYFDKSSVLMTIVITLAYMSYIDRIKYIYIYIYGAYFTRVLANSLFIQ